MLSFIKYSLYSTAAVALGAGGALYYYQSKLLYHPNMPNGSRKNVPTPADFGIDEYEDIELISSDGVRIRAYVMMVGEKPESRPTVLLLHANAGNVGHRLPIAKVFFTQMKCNVIALSYRGYGKSEGEPTETGIKLDAQTSLDYILSHPKLEKTKIFLYGQSIGGAVAINLASRNTTRVNGLIVENTFLSLPRLVPHVMPFLSPFLFLLHQLYPSDVDIQSLPLDFPVLFLSGARDELVPPSHLKELYDICKSKNKEIHYFEYGTHNDTCLQPHYMLKISSFIAKYTSKTPLPTPAASVSASETGSFELVEGEDEEEETESRFDIDGIAKRAEDIREKL